MKKLLCIAPHLSTGGLPQYLYKKIELLKDSFDIYLVEWSDVTGGVLVVTRNKILNVLDPNKFFTLGENKLELLDIINKIQPDIIHTEEIPEFYMDFDIASKLYSHNRSYKIVETSHDSSFDVTQKKFFPDKFMFVSQWQIDQYKDIDIPKVLVEYPIEYSDRPNREEALNKLGLDPNKKHILHIGLFTPRKNQAEFFEYAKALPQYEFHCVGNQADNFRWYWEPLMENKPNNVTWWNERTDVDSFYQAMDLFLFTSRGTNSDKETMPLVIREAISYQIPILIYNLEVYQNYFNKFDGINYLDFSDFSYNCSLIESTLYLNDSEAVAKEAYIVGTYPNSSIIEKITIDCLKSLRKDNRVIITTSHCPVSKEIQELSDYVIYDKNNITTQHTFEWWWFAEGPNYKIKAKAAHNKEDNFYHGPACHNNIHNAMALANNLGIEKAYLINYDYHLKNVAPINYISDILNTHSLYSEVIPLDSGDGPQMRTAFMAIKPKTFLNYLPQIFTQEDWDNLQVLKETNSNGLETLWYSFLKDDPKAYWEESSKFETVWNEALDHINFSQAEYFIPLPVHGKDNEYAIIIRTSNDVDSRKFIVKQLDLDGNVIWENPLDITKKIIFWKVSDFDLSKDNSTIYQLEQRDLETDEFISIKEIKINNEYLQNNLYENGHIILS